MIISSRRGWNEAPLWACVLVLLLCSETVWAQPGLAPEDYSLNSQAPSQSAQRLELRDRMHAQWKNGEVASARDVGQELLAMEITLFGEYDGRVARTHRILADYSLELHDDEQAQAAFDQYFEILSGHHAAESWQAAEAARQRKVFEQFLAIPFVDRQMYFDRHREFEQHLDANRLADALSTAEQLVKFTQELLGERHPLTVMESANVVSIQVRRGDWQAVGPQLARMQGILEQEEHPDHPHRAILFLLLADFSEKNGDRKLALQQVAQAIARFESSGALYYQEYPLALAFSGALLWLDGQQQAALEPLRKAEIVARREGVDPTVREQVIDNSLCHVLQRVAVSEQQAGNWDAAVSLLEEAVQQATDTWGIDHYRTVDLRLDLDFARTAAQWTAEKQTRYLEMQTLQQQIVSRSQASDWKAATELAQQRADVLTKLLGKMSPASLRARFELLSTIRNAKQAQVEVPESSGSDGFDLVRNYEEVFGKAHAEYGDLCLKQAQWLDPTDSRAADLARQAAAAYQASLTAASDEYAIALNVLGTVLANTGEAEAVPVLREAIDLWESGGSRGSFRHGEALLTLGAYFYEQDNPYEARLLLAEAAEKLRPRAQGNIALDLAVALNFLGNVASDRGADADALPFYREAIQLFESTPWQSGGLCHERSIAAYVSYYQWTLYNAANSLHRVGNFDQAEHLLLRLLERIPTDSPSDIHRSACYSLARVYATQKRYDDAQEILERAAQVVLIHDADNPLVASGLALEQARLALESGDATAGQGYLDAVFSGLQKLPAPEETSLAKYEGLERLSIRLIESYERLGQWKSALRVRQFAMPYLEVFLDDWPDLLKVERVELKVAEAISAADVSTQQAYQSLCEQTAALNDAAQFAYAGIADDFHPQAQTWIGRLDTELGTGSLPVVEYWEALAGYKESLEAYQEAFRLLTYSLAGQIQLFGYEHYRPAQTSLKAGRIVRLVGEYQKAIEFDGDALELLKAVRGEQSLEVIQAQLEMAHLYADMQNEAAALPYARAAVEGYRRLWGERNVEYCQALELTGRIYSGLGEPNIATTYFQQSHDLLKDLLDSGDPRLLRSQANLAVAASWKADQIEEARQKFDRVIEDYQQAGRGQGAAFASLLLKYADALLIWEDFAAAEQILQQARTAKGNLDWLANDALEAQICIRLGKAQRHLGNLDEAAQNLQIAADLQRELFGPDSQPLSETLLQLAIVEILRQSPDVARDHVLESLQLQQQILSGVGNLMTDESLSNMLSGSERPLDLLIGLMLSEPPAQADIDEAFYWVLQRKGLALDLSCRRTGLQQSRRYDTQTAAQVERLRALNQQLADLAIRQPEGQSQANIQAQRQLLSRQITELNNELAIAMGAGEASATSESQSVAAVRERLPVDSVLVEFVRIQPIQPDEEPHYVGFLLQGGSSETPMTFADLGSATEIDELIDDLRRETVQAPRMMRISSEADLERRYFELAGPLYAKLFAPFSEQLATAKSLTIGADANLCTLPCGALVDSDERYLVERVDVRYVSSARDLLREVAEPGEGTLIVADPNFDADQQTRQQALQHLAAQNPASALLALRGATEPELRSLRWRRLPGAEQEAREIDQLLQQTDYAPVHTYQGDNAVEEVLKTAQSPRLIHLATHGFYVPLENEQHSTGGERRALSGGSQLARLRTDRNPLLRSGIVLAGANRLANDDGVATAMEDGWFTAQEIARMDFRNTELVVLSACESGLGDYSAGQGVQGIRRAFMNAGAHSVLTSLFVVPDRETHELMTSFYAELVETSDPVAALSQAQRQRIVQRREKEGAAHPFFWASFILLASAENGEGSR